MDERDWLLNRFEDQRPRLWAVAYRMLGSTGEADDAVQEAWLRASRADTGRVENLPAWLTTVVARLCLNMLRSRKLRREEPLDVRTPEQVIGHQDGSDPEQEALLMREGGGRTARQGPAHRFRFRAEMGLRLLHWPLCWTGATSKR